MRESSSVGLRKRAASLSGASLPVASLRSVCPKPRSKRIVNLLDGVVVRGEPAIHTREIDACVLDRRRLCLSMLGREREQLGEILLIARGVVRKIRFVDDADIAQLHGALIRRPSSAAYDIAAEAVHGFHCIGITSRTQRLRFQLFIAAAYFARVLCARHSVRRQHARRSPAAAPFDFGARLNQIPSRLRAQLAARRAWRPLCRAPRPRPALLRFGRIVVSRASASGLAPCPSARGARPLCRRASIAASKRERVQGVGARSS